MILTGDIGGTKTILAAFSRQQGPHEPVAEATFASQQYSSLEAVIEDFQAQFNITIDAACFGVAGPVVDGQARITNLPWRVDSATLQRELNVSEVRLLNDLEAVASSVPILEADDLHTLNPGRPVQHGTIGVVAPGTGLGEAFLTWNGSQYRAHPSEGGHATFAPRTETEIELLRYLWQRYEHVSYERVCSGMGLPNVYAFYNDTLDIHELPELTRKMTETSDITPLIVNAALDTENPSELARCALETFVNILSAEASNLALKVLSTGGIYLGGGIPPRILQVLTPETFMPVFRDKGRFADFLDAIPVHVILNPRAALLGTARVAML